MLDEIWFDYHNKVKIETLKKNQHGQTKINSSNLYQMFSYLLNQRKGCDKTENATGILLCPTVDVEYNLDYKYENHKIQIRTVNLNTNWQNISKRLKEIIGVVED